MSFWRKLIGKENDGTRDTMRDILERSSHDASRYAIVDVEVGFNSHKIQDIGSLRFDDALYHDASVNKLRDFLSNVDYLCGHNIIHHDAKFLFGNQPCQWR